MAHPNYGRWRGAVGFQPTTQFVHHRNMQSAPTRGGAHYANNIVTPVTATRRVKKPQSKGKKLYNMHKKANNWNFLEDVRDVLSAEQYMRHRGKKHNIFMPELIKHQNKGWIENWPLEYYASGTGPNKAGFKAALWHRNIGIAQRRREAVDRRKKSMIAWNKKQRLGNVARPTPNVARNWDRVPIKWHWGANGGDIISKKRYS